MIRDRAARRQRGEFSLSTARDLLGLVDRCKRGAMIFSCAWFASSLGSIFPVIQLRGTKTQFSSRLVGCGTSINYTTKTSNTSIEVRPSASAWHHQPARMIWTTHHRTCNNGLPCKIVPPAQQTLPLLQIECSQFSAYPKILAGVELE